MRDEICTPCAQPQTKIACGTCRYKAYLKHITQRVNSINGLPYNADSTIMAWELLNEPRCQASDGCAPGTLAVTACT